MKKILPLLLIASIMLCSFVTVNAENEIPNAVDAINSGFEEATTLKDTNWYKLINEKGLANGSESLFTGIEIKTDGGHTGNNYLSATLKQSWHAPSINIYPFIESVGPDSYVLSFWYKSNKNIKLTKFLVRGLASDAYEDSGEFQPDIISKGNGNYYGYIDGSSTDPDLNGWRCFVSNPFEVVEEQFDGKKHNWWFCLDQLSATKDSPLILDIDDFGIYSELDFEKPEIESEKEIVTEITYLTNEVKTNAIVTENAEPITTPSPTSDEQGGEGSNTFNIEVPLIIGTCVLVLSAAVTAVIIIKKKKN